MTTANRRPWDVAHLLGPIVAAFLNGPLPVRPRAWDGNEIGPRDAPRSARAWRLCLTGGALAFEESRRGGDQILARRPGPAGPGSAASGPAESGSATGTGPKSGTEPIR